MLYNVYIMLTTFNGEKFWPLLDLNLGCFDMLSWPGPRVDDNPCTKWWFLSGPCEEISCTKPKGPSRVLRTYFVDLIRVYYEDDGTLYA